MGREQRDGEKNANGRGNANVEQDLLIWLVSAYFSSFGKPLLSTKISIAS